MRRALGIAVAGVALTLIAFLFDTSPLFVLGAGLGLLGIATPAWIFLASRGAGIERRLDDRRVIEDEPLEALIEVRVGRLRLPCAEVLEPLATGPIPLAPRSRAATIRVVVRFDRRGRRKLEPPSLIVHDPLDIARIVRCGGERPRELMVLPRTMPVNWAQGARGDRRSQVAAFARSEALAAVDLDGLRPYRPGTPASRIHWQALARGAGLLERRLQAEGDTRPLVVLDAGGDARIEDIDAAVRAAASLTLELAREGGCALLLPGERRPTPIERDLASWPAAHVRLALVAGGPGSPAPMLGAQTRMGPVIHVAALPLERLPPAVLGIARGARVLVVPGPPDAEQRAGARAPGSNRPLRPSFEVAGCRGYVLRSRPGERAA